MSCLDKANAFVHWRRSLETTGYVHSDGFTWYLPKIRLTSGAFILLALSTGSINDTYAYTNNYQIPVDFLKNPTEGWQKVRPVSGSGTTALQLEVSIGWVNEIYEVAFRLVNQSGKTLHYNICGFLVLCEDKPLFVRVTKQNIEASSVEYEPASLYLAPEIARIDALDADLTAEVNARVAGDTYGLDRAHHTGSQLAATISDLVATIRAQVEAELLAGTNVTITPSGVGAARQLTIASTGGGGGGGGGGLIPIFEEVVAVAKSQITFNGIPQTYRHLLVTISGRGTKAATFMTPFMTLNNDASAIYDWQRGEQSNTAQFGLGSPGVTSWQYGYLAAATAPAGVASASEIRIYDYTSAVYHKTMTARGGVKTAAGAPAANQLFTDYFCGWYRSAAPIIRLDLFAEAGTNFDVGTVVTVWGMLGTVSGGTGATGRFWDVTAIPTDAAVQATRTTNFADPAISIAGFTWINQGTATAAIQRKRLVMVAPAGSTAVVASRILKPAVAQNLPATPWCVQVPVTLYGTDNYNMTGIAIRNATNSKLYNPGIAIRRDQGTSTFFIINRLNNEATFASDAVVADPAGGYNGVIAVGCDGANISFWYSRDGREWPKTPNFTETLAAFLGAGGAYEFGFMVESRAADQATGGFDNAVILNQATPVPHGQLV